MSIYIILIVVLIITVSLLIRAEFDKNIRHIYIYKPLSTILVILIALLPLIFRYTYHSTYLYLVVLGLLFSLGGDIALMFKTHRLFRTGLLLFLLAHLVYACAFTSFQVIYKKELINGIILLVIGLCFYGYLYPGLEKKFELPVFFYILIISLMVNRAISTVFHSEFHITQALFIISGAILFYISDVILAVNKFRRPFRLNRISLAFYYTGQVLIALSTTKFYHINM